MHRLIPSRSSLPKYFAGLLYTVNPFVYERFLAGHTFILLAYSIFPFAIRQLIKFLEEGSSRNILFTAIWMTIVAMLDIRFLIFFFILFGFFLILYLFKKYKRITNIQLLKEVFLVIALFIVLNLYWILSPYYHKVIFSSKISLAELDAFATHPKVNLNVLFNVTSMYGFWKEPQFLLPKDTLPSWYIFPLVLIGLSIYGFIYLVKDKHKRAYAIGLLWAWCVSLIFACGISLYPLKSQTLFLYQKIPLLYIFREPQKFAALMVFGYAYLGGMGVQSIMDKFKEAEKIKKFFISLFLILLFAALPIYTHSIWAGLQGQIKPSHYPLSWYKVNEILNQDKQDFKVLFLPWHRYMAFDFTDGRIISNPAADFFDKTIIQNDNPELDGVLPAVEQKEARYIQELLKNRKNNSEFGRYIKPLNIKYIIFSKNSDYKKYDFLYKQKDLKIYYNTPDLVLFKNLEYILKEKSKSVIKGSLMDIPSPAR